MKNHYFLLLIIALVFLGCKSQKNIQIPEDGAVTSMGGGDKKMVQGSTGGYPATDGGPTPIARVRETMGVLADDALRGRDSGTPGLEKAADYIIAVFQENGIIPYFPTFRDTLTNFEGTTYNVVGLVPGNDPNLKDQYIVLGAHYDHIGQISGAAGDNIANGANDNASGTTVVIELARYFGNTKSNGRSLIFALFSAEEKGLLGSKHLAKKLGDEDIDLYAMLNYEMVGVPMVGKDHMVYLTGYDRSNLAAVTNAYAQEKLVGFLPKAKEYKLYQRSDNYAFHDAFGVPSHTYSSFDFTNFEHYHKVGDEVSEMDFGHMATLIDKMIPVVRGISNAADREIQLK